MTESVLAKLEQQPVVVEVAVPNSDNKQTVGVSKFDVQRWIASSLGRNNSARDVPRNVYEMAQGDYSRIAQELYGRRGKQTGVHAMAALTDLASWASTERLRPDQTRSEYDAAGRYHRLPVISVGRRVGPALAGR